MSLRVSIALTQGRARTISHDPILDVSSVPLFKLVALGQSKPLGKFSLALASSQNTFTYIDPLELNMQWGVVGKRSAGYLRTLGLEPIYVASNAKELEQSIGDVSGSILFIGAEEPAEPMRHLMRNKAVKHWPVYKRVEQLPQIPVADWVVALSPALLRRYALLYKRDPFPKLAVIGPTTANAANQLGIPVSYIPDVPDLNVILKHLSRIAER